MPVSKWFEQKCGTSSPSLVLRILTERRWRERLHLLVVLGFCPPTMSVDHEGPWLFHNPPRDMRGNNLACY